MGTAVRRALTSTVAIACAMTALVVAGQPAHAAFVSSLGGPISRSEVIERAAYWEQHTPGVYSQTSYSPDPTGSHNYRRDCSGLVDMAWHLNSDPNTEGLASMATPISRSELRAGDILDDTVGPTSQQHVILFNAWEADHVHFSYYSFGGGDKPKFQLNASMNDSSWDTHPTSDYRAYRYNKIFGGPGSYSGDDRADLLFVDTAGAGDISEYPNLSPGNWGTTTKVGSGWAGVDPNSVYFADMNGDGRTDLLQLTGDSIRYFPNLSPGNWGTTTTIGSGWTGVDPKTLYFADMNGDGKADLLQLTGDNIRYFPNLSPGNWGTTTTIGSGWTGVDPKTLYFADMNGDGKADLLQLTGDNIRYFPNLSPGNWGTTTTIGSGWTGVNPKTLYFADMNGDGKTDLLQYNTTTHLISYYPNLSPGNWGTTTTIGSGWTTNPDNLHFA
ncbi:FG-GAP repeat domain-containing protein [Dactylosporangium sp. CA-139066]|uniref:FG-GAP repeat domain-containing protein n=1 Tax=Dactylosporangium sp. CA-139066 TaxID=3239930 RepID=UPI003D8E7D96